jgi:hypothetical protein
VSPQPQVMFSSASSPFNSGLTSPGSGTATFWLAMDACPDRPHPDCRDVTLTDSNDAPDINFGRGRPRAQNVRTEHRVGSGRSPPIATDLASDRCPITRVINRAEGAPPNTGSGSRYLH